MLKRQTKQLFYVVAGPLMQANAAFYRYCRAPNSELLRLHLGPGQRKYLPGWINIDANMFTGKCDVWADLRNPLPFANGVVDGVYSHHMVEHLPDLEAHFQDVFRCLKPGGTYRVAGPNGDAAIKKFTDGDNEWFDNWPSNRKSIGGRFENFIFCKGEHLTILTFTFLEELMAAAGFTNIRQCLPTKETFNERIFGDCLPLEEESDLSCPHTLVIEAEKPLGTG